MQTRKSAFLAFVVFILAFPVFCDQRTENIDIILALDKSLSMAEDHKIDGVKNYVDTWLLDQVVIPGDDLIIVAFYGKADVIVSQKIQNNADILKIKQIISQIRANGRFTDIGNALDVLKAQLDNLSKDGRKKFVLMMTDGKQEAPPTSKYYSPDGTFNHEFLSNTKTIQQQGWKIQILGIGTEAEAQALAAQLAGSYTELSGDLSVEKLKAQTENLLGSVSAEGQAVVSRVGMGGRSSVSLTLKSEGYSQEVRIGIASIQAVLMAQPAASILETPYTVKIPPSGTVTVRIPVRFPSNLQPGSTSGMIVFSFLAGERFNPSEFTVSFVVAGAVENYWWLVVLGIVVLALIVAAVIFLVRRLSTGGGGTRFSVRVDDEKIGQGAFSLKQGAELFLNEMDRAFAMTPRRNAHSFARFRLKEGVLGFDILKIQRFPRRADAALEGVLGRSFVIRSEDGKDMELNVERVEAKKPQPRSAEPAPAAKAPAKPPRRTRAAAKPSPKKPKAPQTKLKRPARRSGR